MEIIYFKLTEKKILPADLAVKKGVYTLYALDDNKKPITLDRLLGQDPNGILYIGQTSKQDFKKRIDMLRRVLDPLKKSTGHSGAKNYKQIEKLRSKFPVECLHVSILESDNPKQKEAEIIEDYRQMFGEVPPFNGSK